MKNLATLLLAASLPLLSPSCDSENKPKVENSPIEQYVPPPPAEEETKARKPREVDLTYYNENVDRLFHNSQPYKGVSKSDNTIYLLRSVDFNEGNQPIFEGLQMLLEAGKVEAFVAENLYQKEDRSGKPKSYQPSDRDLSQNSLFDIIDLDEMIHNHKTPIYGTQTHEGYNRAIEVLMAGAMNGVVSQYDFINRSLHISPLSGIQTNVAEFQENFESNIKMYRERLNKSSFKNPQAISDAFTAAICYDRQNEVLDVVSQLLGQGNKNIVSQFGSNHLTKLRQELIKDGHTVYYCKKPKTSMNPFKDFYPIRMADLSPKVEEPNQQQGSPTKYNPSLPDKLHELSSKMNEWYSNQEFVPKK